MAGFCHLNLSWVMPWWIVFYDTSEVKPVVTDPVNYTPRQITWRWSKKPDKRRLGESSKSVISILITLSHRLYRKHPNGYKLRDNPIRMSWLWTCCCYQFLWLQCLKQRFVPCYLWALSWWQNEKAEIMDLIQSAALHDTNEQISVWWVDERGLFLFLLPWRHAHPLM